MFAGSLLEGGGQILRNASALAAITGSSIQVDKIRAGALVARAFQLGNLTTPLLPPIAQL